MGQRKTNGVPSLSGRCEGKRGGRSEERPEATLPQAFGLESTNRIPDDRPVTNPMSAGKGVRYSCKRFLTLKRDKCFLVLFQLESHDQKDH